MIGIGGGGGGGGGGKGGAGLSRKGGGRSVGLVTAAEMEQVDAIEAARVFLTGRSEKRIREEFEFVRKHPVPRLRLGVGAVGGEELKEFIKRGWELQWNVEMNERARK